LAAKDAASARAADAAAAACFESCRLTRLTVAARTGAALGDTSAAGDERKLPAGLLGVVSGAAGLCRLPPPPPTLPLLAFWHTADEGGEEKEEEEEEEDTAAMAAAGAGAGRLVAPVDADAAGSGGGDTARGSASSEDRGAP
jgi:hypothetical protein